MCVISRNYTGMQYIELSIPGSLHEVEHSIGNKIDPTDEIALVVEVKAA
jgi:hypothetical protein